MNKWKWTIPGIVMIIFFQATTLLGQSGKIPLDHSVYDQWNEVRYQVISDNGGYVAYNVVHQKPGLDPVLYLYRSGTGKLDSFVRGGGAVFTPDSRFLVFKVRPPYKMVRALKLKKTKKDKMPKDSLFIYTLSGDSFITRPGLKSFSVSSKNNNIVAALIQTPEVEEIEADSTKSDSSDVVTPPKKSKKGKKGDKDTYTLWVYNAGTGLMKSIDKVLEYNLSDYGTQVLFLQSVNDTIDSFALKILDAETGSESLLKSTNGSLKKIALDHNGRQAAFLLTEDTSRVKLYRLWYSVTEKPSPKMVVGEKTPGFREGWSVSDNGSVYFSKSGEKLYFGVAPKPVEEPEDTLLAEEKYHVDIWNWRDKRLQPQQKVQLKSDLRKTYLSVYLPKNNKFIQVGDTNFGRVRTYRNGDGDYAMVFENEPYAKSYTWTSARKFDAWLVNLKTGEKKKILTEKDDDIGVSPGEKYVYWYESADSSWRAMDIKNGKSFNLSLAIPHPVYQEVFDVPAQPYPYGLAGWVEGDKYVLIYDRYDLWLVNPAKPQNARNLTNGYGRRNNIRLRIVTLDREQYAFIPGQKLLLRGFDEDNNWMGFYNIKIEESTAVPQQLVYDNFSFSTPLKAKNADKLIWRKMTYSHYPDLYYSLMDFTDARRISFANPQQKNYLWGSVETVNWTSLDGRKLKGLLYKPDNFDSRKKYPMIVYYYERNSETINRYLAPKPSYSVISFPMYTSNGYLIFVPDIYYSTGHPGKSAYECIMSGVLALCEYPFVDRDNIGLQGQSWGGYQTAFMVTQTDFFKAAMGGAVVSNMTSAYGGIRWGSGISRMFQYEEGQSRIGGSLWEYPELYIENSPVFFADRVSTPILLMHNDNDGAVPWYQGIEFFGALRRLNKPVWMLTYNNEEHNLRRWPDRVDLSIRMMQFFDHYLKGKPAPVWMTDGIPATKKGKTNGYKLKTR